MPHWQMFGYGAAGGALISLLTLHRFIQSRRKWPWRVRNGPTIGLYLTGEIIRTVLGAAVAWGLAASGQLGVLGAMIVGAGAPAILEQWQRTAPRTYQPEPGRALRGTETSRESVPHEAVVGTKIFEGGA